MGDKLDLPDWWHVIDAAVYAGIPAWEFMDKPRIWVHWYREHGEAIAARHEVEMERMQRGQAN